MAEKVGTILRFYLLSLSYIMVRYYGRARIRTGSVNTNQIGINMSGCPQNVGKSGKNIRSISKRVNCMNGLCFPFLYHGVPWTKVRAQNRRPYCKPVSSKCSQASPGVGNINTPYRRTSALGETGCGVECTTVPMTLSTTFTPVNVPLTMMPPGAVGVMAAGVGPGGGALGSMENGGMMMDSPTCDGAGSLRLMIATTMGTVLSTPPGNGDRTLLFGLNARVSDISVDRVSLSVAGGAPIALPFAVGASNNNTGTVIACPPSLMDLLNGGPPPSAPFLPMAPLVAGTPCRLTISVRLALR